MHLNLNIKRTDYLVTLGDLCWIKSAIRKKLEEVIVEDPDAAYHTFQEARDLIKHFARLVRDTLKIDIKNLSFKV